MSLDLKLSDNLRAIQQRIADAALRAGRGTDEVTLVAVTKSVGLDEIRILRDLGVTHFAENRVDMARGKIEALADPRVTWHMVGNVQRRKAKEVRRLFDTIDAVDRIELAEELQRRCEADDARCRVLIEVNISGEVQKHGVAPGDLDAMLQRVAKLDRIHIDGLMTMAPMGLSREPLIRLFGGLRVLANDRGLAVVSMGMSGDFEEAIEAGATQVRVGRALFE